MDEMFDLYSGIDLVDIDRLASLKPNVKERFIKRVYTEREINEAADSNASLAGKFAAKEAVAKALGTGIGAVNWQDIEILRGNGNKPQLKLHRKAQSIADELKLTCWSISISHTNTQAVAVAIAVGALGRDFDENTIS